MKIILLFSIIILGLVSVNSQSGYALVSSCQNCNGVSYFATLRYLGTNNYYINTTNLVIKYLNFSYCFKESYHLVVRITDANKTRWEVPKQYPFPYNDDSKPCIPLNQAYAKVNIKTLPFSFNIVRTGTNEVIFDSSAGPLIFSDYYLQLSTSLPTPNIYGLGERAYKLDLGTGGTFSLLNKDQFVVIEDGTAGHGLYGYHPVYLQREKSYNFSMVLLRSSNAMDAVIKNQNLTYKVTGGMFEFNMFLGDSSNGRSDPETVTKQYHTWLGKWTMHPFWSLGHHQCKYGYHNVTELGWVLGNYSKYQIPLDTIWTDIDYMDKYVDFTMDPVNFSGPAMTQLLKTYNKRWVPIIDAGIAINNNPLFKMALEKNIFVKDPNGNNLLGSVWPGDVHYPDFFNPNTSSYWAYGLSVLHDMAPFSGIWLDMNEVSNFENGEKNWTADPSDILNNPPYVPAYPGSKIYEKTMRMDAVYYGNLIEYNVHNTWGFLETKATYDYLKTLSNLTFILTRSTFYGSGQFAMHWTGDNAATWEYLYLSLPGIMNFNIFGMPFTGPDMCGFLLNTTEELCSRWYQAGTFYPFSRNHAAIDSNNHEPYALGPTLLATARASLYLRYAMLKHFYALFLRANGTGTVFKPMFYEFPNENIFYNQSLDFVNTQYMIGSSLMVTPVLKEGVNYTLAYFPQSAWYELREGALIRASNQTGAVLNVTSHLNETVPTFIRGGHLVAVQEVDNVLRTDDLNSNFLLLLALQYSNTVGTLRNYYASGPMIALQDLNDSNIVTKCFSYNCVYNVMANFSYTPGGSYALALRFTLPNNNIGNEQVYVSGIRISGDWTSSQTEEFALHATQAVDENGESVDIEMSQVSSANSFWINIGSPVSIYPGRTLTFSGKMPSTIIDI